ncbi:MAG: DNA primase [Bacteroidales bacterium]|nr:DNA primase [Bacteroidales bacterium]
MIPHETIQKIKDAIRIEEVISDFVTLRRRGADFIGLCPFHQEKTPSFHVSSTKGFFKCFGCGEGGDAIAFVMKHEGYQYGEALKYLAQKYGITVVETEQTAEEIEKAQTRETLFDVSKFAADIFKNNLWKHDAGKAIGLSYFRERGFSDGIIEKFGLGYSLDTWDVFTSLALSRGYSEAALLGSGLSLEKDGRIYDRFRGRVMFPIHNLSGWVIGFGGRQLSNEKTGAKYVNSPASEIYDKSKVLYGIYFAKKTIADLDLAYLVEGYTDVISLHQAGVTNVVASSGTSLTVEQIKLVSRFSKNITVLYDGDAAGIKASLRGIDMLLEKGMNVRVVPFPDGEDPDSFCRSHSSEEVHDFLQSNAVDFIRFKTSLLLKEVGADPIKRAALIQDILESIALIPDEIHRMVYIQECSRMLNMDEANLINKLNYIFREKYKKSAASAERQIVDLAGKETHISDSDVLPTDSIPADGTENIQDEKNISLIEKDILRLLVNYGNKEIEKGVSVAECVIKHFTENEMSFSKAEYQKIFDYVKNAFNGNIDGISSGHIPDVQELLSIEDDDVKNLVITLASSQYSVSDNWAKKGVYFQNEEDRILDFWHSYMYEQLLAYINEQIEKNQHEITASHDVDEQFILLSKRNGLNMIRKKLSAELNRIVR